jgi:predicted nucleic acid-binding protein
VRIYLDVCCLNRPFDDQSQERVRLEAEAVLVILRRIESAQWELVGSEAVEFELGRMPDEERRQRVRALARLATTNQAIDDAVRIRARQWVAAGLKPVDALHLACAETMSVDVFLTTDDRLLRAIRRVAGVRIPANNPLPWLHDVLA